MRRDEFPDFVPDYKLELYPKAKVTNFLQNNPANFGWIVDEKLKNVLEKHKLPRHQFNVLIITALYESQRNIVDTYRTIAYASSPYEAR